jgi:threonine synthase
VQAAGAAPFARAFRDGFARRVRVRAETVASAIRIGDPASWDRAVEAVRFTSGVVTAVSDEEILAAKAAVDTSGVGCEPASAASVAGVRAMARAGTIGRDARVVAVLTGHLLKEPAPTPAQPAMEIEPDLAAVEAMLRDLARGEGR